MPDSLNFTRKPVLVLGASGYIGSRVVAALSSSPVYSAVAASRRSGVRVDATDPDALRAALRDVDCVVNCIAGNDRTMVRAAEALCEAARAVPPRRIIHLSSMAVYGAATGWVSEDHAPVGPVSGYGRAKLECERIVLKYASDGGDAVVLRPTCVFGPGSPQWTERLGRLLKARRIGDLGPAGDGYCNLAFIDDLVAAILFCLDASDCAGGIYNISSSMGLTWNEFLMAFGKALGATPVRRVPARTLRIETKLLAPVGRLLPSLGFETITPSLAALWRQDIRIDCLAAERMLSLRRTPVGGMIEAVMNGSLEPAFS